MIDNYKIITITHKSAQLKDIGKFILPELEHLPVKEQLNQLKLQLSIKELMYLPTCNRVMFFFVYDKEIDSSFLEQFTQKLYPNQLLEDAIEKYIVLEGEEALNHIFEVASSVDSLVVGEREILRQLRLSYAQCSQQKLTDDHIRLAMDATVKTAKSVYANTKIGQKQVSVVSLAIKKLLDSSIAKDAKILIIGAGQTNNLVCKFLSKYQFSNITIFNRTIDKAQELADLVQGEALPITSLENYNKGFDCIIVCTASVEPIIHKKNYTQLLQNDTTEKIILDLAIPNNVDREVVEHFNIHYIEIEGLKTLAQKNLAFRTQEISIAKVIIQNILEEFKSIYKERQLEKALSDMPIKIKAVKSKALNEVFRKEMDNLDAETQELVARMMTYMEKKCIGIPMKVAKETILP